MSLHATDNLDDAYRATRALLLPFDAGTWLRLTLVSIFVGGVGGFGQSFQGGGTPTDGVEVTRGFHGLGGLDAVVVGLIVGLLLVGAAFVLVGSVMEFVLVAALATETVTIRSRFREHLGDGLRLFGFRLALFVLALVVVVLPILVVFFGFFGPGLGLAGPLAFLLLLPLVMVAVAVLGVIHGFTTVFVVPIMWETDCGVLEGWRRLYPVVREQPAEYAVYLVLSVVLSWVGGLAVSIVLGIVGLVVFVPLGLLGAFVLLGGGLNPLVLAVVAPLVLLGVLVLLVLFGALSVPVVVYLRYYALLELGDTSAYDLVAERRAEIRGS